MRNFILLYISITFTSGLVITGCLNTEGTLKIKGKVIDEYTKMQIPGRDIIVQGLVNSDKVLASIDAGQFSADSSGCFTYTLRKIKDAYYYNFCLVGDSDYPFTIKKLGLSELKQNAKYLSFSLSKLVDLTIKIHRKSKTPLYDTLYLFWKSNDFDGRLLYHYKIDNFEKTDSSFGLTSGLELEWIGGKVHSVIKTKVFADKMTKISWTLVRNKKKKEITDTITCRRDLTNIVYFTY